MSDLLVLAQERLADTSGNGNRIACWLARGALEEVIDGLLDAAHVSPGPLASARSKLTCLEVLYEGSGVPAQAQYVWSRLSEACHQHAYELSPTYSETKHLVELVQVLAEATTVSLA